MLNDLWIIFLFLFIYFHFIHHRLLGGELDQSHDSTTGSENTSTEKNPPINSVDDAFNNTNKWHTFVYTKTKIYNYKNKKYISINKNIKISRRGVICQSVIIQIR